jgi:tRNA-splicing ligase RtcB (3'-phosphate/5'-hydroxy nucleic acid ligase)
VKVEQIGEFRWRLPREGKMRVDGIVYADEAMLRDIRQDNSLEQVANVAHLPGIVGASLAMHRHPLGLWVPIAIALDLSRGRARGIVVMAAGLATGIARR